jgi:hypothetical protein
MFGSDDKEKRIPVTITLANGGTIKGGIACGPAASLTTELNRDGLFLGVKGVDGGLTYLAKSSILNVVEGDQEKDVRLPELANGEKPHKVLSVALNADSDEIRRAYLGLARLYHPDNYSAENSAPEIREYAAGMFRRINEAYSILKSGETRAAA